jgi:hypothetical protein
MKPIVHGLEEQFGERIDFVIFDIDNPATDKAKKQYGYRVQPHFFLVDGSGQIVENWLGRVKEETFVEAFDGVLAN